jgi:uncharacterized membrane protein
VSRKPKKQLNNFIKFSGIGIQMIIIICLFSFLGVWLDGVFPNDYSIYVVVFSLLGVALAMYYVIKQVINMNKDK